VRLVLGCVLAAAATLHAVPASKAAPTAPGSRPLRVIAEATSPIGDAKPRFVIDAVLTPGDSPFHSDVQGWFAALPPGSGSDTIEGSCVESQCALSGNLASGKMALSADIAGRTLGVGRLILTDDEGRKVGESPVRFSALFGPIAGIGELAPASAIGAVELSDILMWAGAATGFSNVEDGPVGWLQRQALAEWQASHSKPANGLVLRDELALLRREADRAKKSAGWSAMGEPENGWTAGYPAALLPRKVFTMPGEKRFTSADGQAILVMAVDPPMSPADFDTFVARQVADRAGVKNRSYTRVNGDMEITYEEDGQVISAAYHNRPNGFARLEFSHPIAKRATFAAFETILPRSLRVTDELKPG
jgi:hypothetical protein